MVAARAVRQIRMMSIVLFVCVCVGAFIWVAVILQENRIEMKEKKMRAFFSSISHLN